MNSGSSVNGVWAQLSPPNIEATNEQKAVIFTQIWDRMEAQDWVVAKDLTGSHRYRYYSGHVSPLGALITPKLYRPWMEDLPCWSSVFWRTLELFPASVVPMIEDLEAIFSLVDREENFRNLTVGIFLLNNIKIKETNVRRNEEKQPTERGK